jgi:dipeptidyl aminopeptidase/acylaminoacyl peptidase
MKSLCIVASLVFLSNSNLALHSEAPRNITVKDIIETTRLANVDYFRGANPEGNVAQYSPNGRHFVISLRRADLKADTNDYSMYLFTTSAIFQPEKPRLLLTMRSASNSPAIRGIKWLGDNRTLAFVGERDGVSQVYAIDTETTRLMQKTHHRADVDQFDISLDGKNILFTAEEERDSSLTPEQRLHGVVIENQSLEDIIAGHFNQRSGEERLFYQKREEEEVAIPPTHQINANSRLAFSPDGRFASVTAYFRATRPGWTEYNNQVLQFWGRNPAPAGGASPISQFFLFDSSKRSIQTLLDAPAVYTAASNWATDSHAIYLKSFLPFDGVQGTERSHMIEAEQPVEVAVPSLAVKELTFGVWQKMQLVQPKGLPKVTLEEGINTPPRIFAQDQSTSRSVLLMNLNPQFSDLKFGRVDEFRLLVHGIPILAGLYLPPDYVEGKRYPLVVQTHGYDRIRFSMDGRYEWSSGFAARALAAAGIIVVQMQDFENPKDHDRIGNDRTLGGNLMESSRNFVIACLNEAIQKLEDRGMVDPVGVGISGFSRTVWFVSYMLTHADKQRFRTAVLTDGIDGGYFEYIAGQLTEFDADNGGKSPFGKEGLDLWMKESPGFNMDRVCIPLRLVSIEDRLAQWDWFVASRMQKKPAELIEIPDGTHMLEKPSDRYIAMEGIVDWYRFWLQGYIDPSPDKQSQYNRWKQLEALESKMPRTGCSE